MNLLDSLPSADPGRPALIVGERSVTYTDLAERAALWRSHFLSHGLGPGDRVALIEGNTDSFVAAHLACLGAGLVLVPLNPQSPLPELQAELAAVEPLALVVGSAGGAAHAALQTADSLPKTVFAVDPELIAAGCIDPDAAAGAPPEVVSVEADHPAALLFTSGTAGPPKPAILTHGNLTSSIAAIRSVPLGLEESPQVVLGVIPLFHVFGLNVILNYSLSIGATIVLHDYEGPERTVNDIKRHGVTLVAGPPALWASLLTCASAGADDFATVGVALSGASKLNGRVAEALRDKFGLDVREGYGLTESSGILSSAMGTDAPRGSVGQIFPGVELRIVDQQNQDVLVGDAGEILAKGPMISPGYWNDDEATMRVRDEDGWLKTGDLAIVDDDGCISIVDRLKDLIIVSGFNVHPVEVETALQSHPDVVLAAAVGEGEETDEEAVVAYVVLRPDAAVDADGLIELCRSRLARYKVPKRVEIVDSIPTTAVGKIRRRDLGSV